MRYTLAKLILKEETPLAAREVHTDHIEAKRNVKLHPSTKDWTVMADHLGNVSFTLPTR